MNFKKILSIFFVSTLFLFSGALYAASDAMFPDGWENWPVKHSGAITGKDAPISAGLPAIVQETMKTYNWVQDGKGTKYNVRVNPAQDAPYKSRSGDFIDGSSAVLELVDIKVLLVTEHLLGEALYGVYNFDGEDISGAHSSLESSACNSCHTSYGQACVNGICSQ